MWNFYIHSAHSFPSSTQPLYSKTVFQDPAVNFFKGRQPLGKRPFGMWYPVMKQPCFSKESPSITCALFRRSCGELLVHSSFQISGLSTLKPLVQFKGCCMSTPPPAPGCIYHIQTYVSLYICIIFMLVYCKPNRELLRHTNVINQ